MRAVICSSYGPPEVLQFTEIPKPSPKHNEVLIKVKTTTVHIGDTKVRRLEPGLGKTRDLFFKPLMRLMIGFKGPRKKILGMELAGEVVEVGKNVTLFKTGDPVFASTSFEFGSYVEYRCLAENGIISIKPASMSFEEAAPLSNGGLTALLNLRKAGIKKGQRVLIYGASGSVGTFAVQLAKYYGTEVTGVCSTANLELVRSLGADKVVDYMREDFTDLNEVYDIIFDAVGKISPSKRKKALKQNGVYINVLALSGNFKLKAHDLHFLTGLCEAGKLRSVIDKTYPMAEIVEAHRYVDKGHKKGNVVITI